MDDRQIDLQCWWCGCVAKRLSFSSCMIHAQLQTHVKEQQRIDHIRVSGREQITIDFLTPSHNWYRPSPFPAALQTRHFVFLVFYLVRRNKFVSNWNGMYLCFQEKKILIQKRENIKMKYFLRACQKTWAFVRPAGRSAVPDWWKPIFPRFHCDLKWKMELTPQKRKLRYQKEKKKTKNKGRIHLTKHYG